MKGRGADSQDELAGYVSDVKNTSASISLKSVASECSCQKFKSCF